MNKFYRSTFNSALYAIFRHSYQPALYIDVTNRKSCSTFPSGLLNFACD